jgi:arsenate reductase
MQDAVHNVLFLCTHNSARSILAEGLLNGLGGGRFRGYSAGSHPSGTVRPLALRTLQAMGMPTEGLHSKDWSVFERPDAPRLDFVITVCDQAAGEVCPLWPGQPLTAHWGVADPSAVQGTEDEQAHAYWDTALILKRRIDLMLALPLPALDRLAVQHEVRQIGKA